MQKFSYASCREDSFKNHSIPTDVIGIVTLGVDTIKTIVVLSPISCNAEFTQCNEE